MNSRRTVILIIAIVVSAASAFGLSKYVKGLEDDVFDGAALGQVWIVQSEIPKGTPAEQAIGQGLIAVSELPVEYIPSTSIQDPSVELNNLVAVVDLPKAAVLVSGNFVAPNVLNTGIIDRLEERGMHTVTFSVDQVAGAAYFIEPGDFVNILSNRPYGYTSASDEESSDDTGGTEGDTGSGDTGSGDPGLPDSADFNKPELAYPEPDGGYAGPVPGSAEEATYLNQVRYVFQKAEVIAVGNALPLDLGESEGTEEANQSTGGLITLAVPAEAVQVILAIGFENIYLSLVPPSYEPVPLPPLDFTEQLLPGEDEARLTPYYATDSSQASAE